MRDAPPGLRTAVTLSCLLLLAAGACAPRSQREAIAMARIGYEKDRCKAVLVRLEQARKISRKPLDAESRRMEVECSFRIEDSRRAESRLAAFCGEFDWTHDGTARVVMQRAAVYPVGQAARGVDGYVRFGLRIDDEGRVAEASVQESRPSNMFETVAKKAVSDWRYCPRRTLREGSRYPETAEMRFRHPDG